MVRLSSDFIQFFISALWFCDGRGDKIEEKNPIFFSCDIQVSYATRHQDSNGAKDNS